MAALAGALRTAPWVDPHAIQRWQQRHGTRGAISAIKEIAATGIEVGPEDRPAWIRRFREDCRYFVPADGKPLVVVVKYLPSGYSVASPS